MRRALTALATAVTTVIAMLAIPTTATAAPGNAVLFGDSLLANPPYELAKLMQGPGKVSGISKQPGRCAHGKKRVGVSLQQQTGRVVEDYSCTGAATYSPLANGNTLRSQVNVALAQRSINRGTQYVGIQIGINDTYKGAGIPSQQKGAYMHHVGTEIKRIRRAAPHAKIQLIGYPSVVDRNGVGCWIQAQNLPMLPMTLPPLRSAFDNVHDWQRATAHANGASWLNLEAKTQGHGSCASDSQRYITGVYDNRSNPYNITTHLTHKGNDAVARIIAANM